MGLKCKKTTLLLGFLLIPYLVYSQNSFYRSYVPYTETSIFQFFKDHQLESEQLTNQYPLYFKEHFVNWTELNYFGLASKNTKIEHSKNFIVDPWIVTDAEGKQLRAWIYKDLLSIVVDNDITLKRLVFLSADFRSLLFERLYSPLFINTVNSHHTQWDLYSLLPFTGDGGIIDLFIKSRYYSKEESISILTDTPYIPNSYKKIVLEARDLGLKPALFPNIYSYDKNGKEILIYSFNMANKEKIKANGYAHYLSDEMKIVKEDKVFYTSVIKTQGKSKTDIFISRESYLKLFSSEESIKSLSSGSIYIII